MANVSIHLRSPQRMDRTGWKLDTLSRTSRGKSHMFHFYSPFGNASIFRVVISPAWKKNLCWSLTFNSLAKRWPIFVSDALFFYSLVVQYSSSTVLLSIKLCPLFTFFNSVSPHLGTGRRLKQGGVAFFLSHESCCSVWQLNFKNTRQASYCREIEHFSSI